MNKNQKTEFRHQLKMWRLARHMTQRDLSLRCHVTEQGISAIEHGDVQARTSTMVDIIQNGFEMSYEQFFNGAVPQYGIGRPRQRMSGVPVPHLRKWRVNYELSTRQLAAKVGVTPATINHIENDGYASPALAHRIAHVFGKTLDEMAELQVGHAQAGDMSDDFLEGKSITKIAEELDEEFVHPNRLTAAERKLEATMAAQGIILPAAPKPKAKAPSIARANVSGEVVLSQAEILAALRADAQSMRDGTLEEEVEEE